MGKKMFREVRNIYTVKNRIAPGEYILRATVTGIDGDGNHCEEVLDMVLYRWWKKIWLRFFPKKRFKRIKRIIT